MDNTHVKKWTRAFDEGWRWGHVTTNHVQSINFVFKGTWNLPITGLVRATYYNLGALFANRGLKWSWVLESDKLYTENCMNVKKAKTDNLTTYMITRFERQNFCFIIRKTINQNERRSMGHYNVTTYKKKGRCDGRKFQTFCVPFSLVIIVCSSVCQNAFAQLSNIYEVIKKSVSLLAHIFYLYHFRLLLTYQNPFLPFNLPNLLLTSKQKL